MIVVVDWDAWGESRGAAEHLAQMFPDHACLGGDWGACVAAGVDYHRVEHWCWCWVLFAARM